MKGQKHKNVGIFTGVSGSILYTGGIPDCLKNVCVNNGLNEVLHSAFEILCFLYKEHNSLSNIQLHSFKEEISCENKNPFTLFNLLFSIVDKHDKIFNNGAVKYPFVFDDFDTIDCENVYLTDNKCCASEGGHTVQETIQLILNRVNTLSTKTCILESELSKLKELVLGVTNVNDTPESQVLSCDKYWDGSKYVPPTVDATPLEAISIIDKDLCKVKSLLGYVSELTANRQFVYEDPLLPGNFIHQYSSADSTLKVQNKIQVYLAALKSEVDVLTKRLDSCCKSNCDICVHGYFNNITTNYGSVAGGVASVPYIIVDHSIDTQAGANCPTNVILLDKTYYTLSDGINTVKIPLSNMIGVSILTGNVSSTSSQSARLRFNLSALGLDYLQDITVKLRTETELQCQDTFRALVPRFDNPACDVCEICFNKTNTFDNNNYSATFTLNFSGGAYATTSSVYTISTANPCISIEKKMGQTITLTNFSSSAGASASLCTTCPFLSSAAPLCCGGSNSESELFLFQIPPSHMAAFAVKKVGTLFGLVGPQGGPVAINFDISGDDDDMFTYERLITTLSPSGDPLAGNTFNIARPSGAQYTGDEVSYNNNDIYIATPKLPTSFPAHVSNMCDSGGVFIKWDNDSNIGNIGNINGVGGGDNGSSTWPGIAAAGVGASIDPTNGNEESPIKFNIVPRDINNPHATICMTIVGQKEGDNPFLVLKDKATNGEIFLRGMRVSQCNC